LTTSQRLASLGGVAGPAVFMAAWAVSGRRAVGYSPIGEPISRLAARGAPSRQAMTVGFLAYSIGVGGFATRVDVLGRPAAVAMAANAAAMAAIAALPLGGPGGDAAHVGSVAAAYVSLVSVPLLAALRHKGRRWTAWSTVAGVASGAGLALSLIDRRGRGGWQRAGLTVGQAWVAALAGAVLR
jgi:hypothetical protein